MLEQEDHQTIQYVIAGKIVLILGQSEIRSLLMYIIFKVKLVTFDR